MTKKKKGSELIAEAYDQSADTIQQATAQLADAQRQAEVQRQADQQAAEDARQSAENSIQEQYRQRAGQVNDFYDLINNKSEKDVQQEQAEAAAQQKADTDAAKWAGVTELVSSVANLVGVGAGNAVSQQYRQYSQDWMRKADMDAREHRARIQNLRERQRQVQMHMNQMRLADAQRELAAATARNDANYNRAINEAAQRYKGSLAPAQLEYEAAAKAAEQRQKGVETASRVALQEEAHDLQRRAQNISAQNHKDALAAKMEAQGYDNVGGHWVPNADKMKTIAAAKGKKGSSSGSKGVSYEVVIDGSKAKVNMDKETFSESVLSGVEEIKKDLMAKANMPEGATWDDFVNLSQMKRIKDANGKRIDNPLCGVDDELIAALEHTGDDKSDLETIKRYVREHKSDFPNFNAHLVFMSDQGANYDDEAAEYANSDVVSPAANNDASSKPSWDIYPD